MSSQWRAMFWQQEGRDMRLDGEFLPLGMIATWETGERTQRAVAERDYPSNTSVYGTKWKETQLLNAWVGFIEVLTTP
jgi:hypothetical protein